MKPKNLFLALAVANFAAGSAVSATVSVSNSAATWEGYMNVSNLPANGGAFQFGSGWGIPDLTAVFDDANSKITLGPNVINDTNEYWYQGVGMNPGGPGAPGNKIMEANLLQALPGSTTGETLVFTGTVISYSYTMAHTFEAFIKDFSADYQQVVETAIPITSAGAFSLQQALILDPTRHVQYGFRTVGVNVWATDVAPFGNVVVASVPEPSFGILACVGLGLLLRRKK